MQSNHSWLEMKVELGKIYTWAWEECQFNLRQYIKKLKTVNGKSYLQRITKDSKPVFLKAWS